MGMYATLFCSAKLPGTPPPYAAGPGHDFQTKDLDCGLAVYEITAAGRLVRLRAGRLDATPHAEPEDQHYHGELEFYTSNVSAAGPGGVYTPDGADAVVVSYVAKFNQGNLEEIVELERKTEPALSRAECPWADRTLSPEEAAACRAREAESLVGRTLWVLRGGLDPDAPGYAVEVVAEDDKVWCVKSAGHGLELVHRASRDAILFDSAEAAYADRDKRAAAVEAEKAEFARKIALRGHRPTE